MRKRQRKKNSKKLIDKLWEAQISICAWAMRELAKELQELREMQVRRRDDLPTVPPHIHKEES
jgi:hypothetical protein